MFINIINFSVEITKAYLVHHYNEFIEILIMFKFSLKSIQ